MTGDEKADLGRRAVARIGWRWLPGMLTLPGEYGAEPERVMDDGWPTFHICDAGAVLDWRSDPAAGALPDLTDPATIGCVAALVQEHGGAAPALDAAALVAALEAVSPVIVPEPQRRRRRRGR